MQISVFLDDYRTCPSGYVLAETIDQCISLLRNNCVDHLSLDHDLVSKTRNGLMLVEYMVKNHLYANRITIHSANAVGSKAMYRHLKKAQEDFEMPKSIKVILKPMPLHSIAAGR
ncbi:cyclic-phosphate processing receiver domain-containing protein [Metabacillus idriensis]|uniref:cyclic-phosphate processing receiver domain-containing protein n=1 Tax=Metabacillus idriensis TaxID=324768 RepID=UPI003D2AA501